MFRAIGLVLSWLPTIVAVVTAIDQIVGDGNGEEKKKVALKALYRVLSTAGIDVSNSVKTVISAVVDAIVAVLNILGVGTFRDTPEQETVDLLPSAHLQEVQAIDAEVAAADAPDHEVVDEVVAKAFPNDERLAEIEAEWAKD